MRCALCRQRPASADLLCGTCVEDLGRPFRFTRDRVRTVGLRPSSTVLIDPWGRAHPVEPTTLIGRVVDGAGIEVVEASVSRHHAELVRDDAGAWSIRDLRSTNGTLVNDTPVIDVLPVQAGDRLRIGQVGFYFVDLPVILGGPQRGSGRRARHAPSTWPDDAADLLETSTDDDDAFAEEAGSTRIGLPSIAIELFKPSGAAAGAVVVDGKRAPLTVPQYELLELLCLRSMAEAHDPAETRGFVSSLELIQRISWDTPQRIDDHLKQLVHRLRRLLDRAGIGDLIESRQGSGYRLRVTPVATDDPDDAAK